MLSRKKEKYCLRAVIQYLDGNMNEFLRLTRLARNIKCHKCGHITVTAKIKNKYTSKEVSICTHCGLIQDININVRSLHEKQAC